MWIVSYTLPFDYEDDGEPDPSFILCQEIDDLELFFSHEGYDDLGYQTTECTWIVPGTLDAAEEEEEEEEEDI